MAQALEMFLDDTADEAVRQLRGRLVESGVPAATGSAHVTLAVAGTIPSAARQALRGELRALTIPDLYLHTLGTFPDLDNALLLSAVVDTELLAVHSAVHDALAGRVRDPAAQYLPGSWIPHCTLAHGVEHAHLATGFAALHPITPVRAGVRGLWIVDSRTGESEAL